MVRRRRYPKAFHLMEQCGALQAESGGCSSRTPELPVGALAGCENFSSHFSFKRRICNLLLQRLATLEWRWFKDAITRKEDTAFSVVLQLSNVPSPGVTNQAVCHLLRDGLVLSIDAAKCCTKYSTSSGIGRIFTTVGTGREIQLDARFTFFGPSNCHLSFLAPCGDATNSRRFCQSRDGKERQQFLALRLTVRKAFNRDSLRFRLIS